MQCGPGEWTILHPVHATHGDSPRDGRRESAEQSRHDCRHLRLPITAPRPPCRVVLVVCVGFVLYSVRTTAPMSCRVGTPGMGLGPRRGPRQLNCSSINRLLLVPLRSHSMTHSSAPRHPCQLRLLSSEHTGTPLPALLFTVASSRSALALEIILSKLQPRAIRRRELSAPAPRCSRPTFDNRRDELSQARALSCARLGAGVRHFICFVLPPPPQ